MKVVTLNLWNVNEPLAERMDRVRRFLAEAQPDVVALQEVCLVGGRPQSESLAEAAGARHHAFDIAGEWCGRVEGLAIAARGASLSVRAHELPLVARDRRRICQVAELENADGRWWLCNVHLAYHPSAAEGRRRQLEAVLELLGDERAGRPGVLMGDLNDVPGSPALAPLRDSCLVDAWADEGAGRPFTFARTNQWVRETPSPDRVIDYVWTSPPVRARGIELALHETARVASDHYAVVADLERLPVTQPALG